MKKVLDFARSELNHYYHLVTGENEPNIQLIVDASLAEASDDCALDDWFSISIKGDTGHIKGINARSVLIGVYRFFRELGCVFTRPGQDGEKIVHCEKENISVSLVCKPHNRFRTITIEGGNSIEDVLDLIDWSIKNGFNSYFTQFRDSYTFFEHWYNHERNPFKENRNNFSEQQSAEFLNRIIDALKCRGMLYHAVGHGWTCECLGYPSKGWHKVSDEDVLPHQRQYIAQINGQRKFFLDTPLYSQLCYSNPKVREMIVDELISYIQSHEGVDYLHFWLGDNFNNFCECDACRQKMPTDWYFMMLNDLDRRLTALQKDTKIVFLIYFELLWPAKEVKLENPDRFVMMFAPITRTYSNSLLPKDKPLNKDLPLPEYEINRITFPSSTEGNLAFLFEHQKQFKGDAFDFDYHLMWEPYKDLSGLQIASVIYDDVRTMDDLGMRGIVSCQIQKVFMPHGFGAFVMGRTLEDPTLSYQALYEEYFSALYGQHYEWATGVLQRILASSFGKYLRNECEQVNADVAQNLEETRVYLQSVVPEAEARKNKETDSAIWLNLDYLQFYCELLQYYCVALRKKAMGEKWEGIESAFLAMRNFLFSNEDRIAKAMDTYQFDLMSEQILRGDWTVMQQKDS